MNGSLQVVALGRYADREGSPLLAVQPRGAVERHQALLDSVPGAHAWSGWVRSADELGAVVGPLASELRAVGLRAAPTGPAVLLITLDPDGESTAVEWHTSRPGNWCRRIVRAGVDFDPDELRRTRPVPSVAATAQPSPVATWSEDDLLATLGARCRMTSLLERGHIDHARLDALLERLGRLRQAGRTRPLTATGGTRR